MKFNVYKSGLDGISGGGSCELTIDEVLREVFYSKGFKRVTIYLSHQIILGYLTHHV